MRIVLNDAGQPPPFLNQERREARNTSELLGVIRGVLADGAVCDKEILYMAQWLINSRDLAVLWPFNKLVDRIAEMLDDGVISEDERSDLKVILTEIIGAKDPAVYTQTATTFPLTKPEPEVIFDQNQFVLTGKFATGTRTVCESQILSLGGTCCDRVTLRTDFLVIGDLSSRDWANTSYGRKFETAIKFRESKPSLYIVSERRWHEFLYGMTPAGSAG